MKIETFEFNGRIVICISKGKKAVKLNIGFPNDNDILVVMKDGAYVCELGEFRFKKRQLEWLFGKEVVPVTGQSILKRPTTD